MRSVRPWVEELLENDYRVVFYAGQLDIIVAYPLIRNFIQVGVVNHITKNHDALFKRSFQKLKWKGAKDYKKAKRDKWYVENDLAGYATTVGTFTEILVRDSGHMVPTEQPVWALDMYHRIIFNKSFVNDTSTVLRKGKRK